MTSFPSVASVDQNPLVDPLTSYPRNEEQTQKSSHSSNVLNTKKFFYFHNYKCPNCFYVPDENLFSLSCPSSSNHDERLYSLKTHDTSFDISATTKETNPTSPFPPIATFEDITQPAFRLLSIVLSRVELAYDTVTLNRRFCGQLVKLAKCIIVSIPATNYKSSALSAMQLRTLLDKLIRDLFSVLEFLKRNRIEYLHSDLVSRHHENLIEPIKHTEYVVDGILHWAIQVHKSLMDWVETWDIQIGEKQDYIIHFQPKCEKKICLFDWLKESQEKALFIEWGTKLGWMVMILDKLKQRPSAHISSKQIWISGDILDPNEIEIESAISEDFQGFFNEAIAASRLLLEIAIGIPNFDIPDIYELPTDLKHACPEGFLDLCRSCYSTRPPSLNHLYHRVFSIAPTQPVPHVETASTLSCRANLSLTYLPSLRKLAEMYLIEEEYATGITWLQCAASHGDGSSAFLLLSYLHLHHDDLRSFVHYLHLGIRVGHLNSFKAWCQLHPLIAYMAKNIACQVTEDLEQCRDERYY